MNGSNDAAPSDYYYYAGPSSDNAQSTNRSDITAPAPCASSYLSALAKYKVVSASEIT